MVTLVQNFDSSILLFIKEHMHSTALDKAMITFTSLGNGGMIWIAIACLLMISKKYRRLGFMTFAALILATIFGEEIIKHIVRRIRPSANIDAANLLIAKPLSYSFPSGHTTSSFAAAGVLSKYLKRYALGFYILAALVAFSRMYLYVHYPTDIIAGIILGLICSRIVIHMFRDIKRETASNT